MTKCSSGNAYSLGKCANSADVVFGCIGFTGSIIIINEFAPFVNAFKSASGTNAVSVSMRSCRVLLNTGVAISANRASSSLGTVLGAGSIVVVYIVGIAMTLSGDFLIRGIAAARAGHVVLPTGLGTGSGLTAMLLLIVRQLFDSSCLIMVATATVSALSACLGAGCRIDLIPVTVIVSESRVYVSSSMCRITATVAMRGLGSVLCTGSIVV